MDTKAIIQKYIEREERYIADADERRDVDDHKWHRAKKRAFEEIAPTVQQLLDKVELLEHSNADLAHNRKLLSDEKQQLLDENERLKWESAWVGAHQEDARRSADYWKKHYLQLQADKVVAVEALDEIKRVTRWFGDEQDAIAVKRIVGRALERIESGEKNDKSAN